MVFVRERRTALIWSARGELLAWSLAETPAQLWYRDPPSRNVAALLHQAGRQRRGRPARAGRRRSDGTPPGQRLGPRGQRPGRHHHLRERQGPAARRLRGRQVGPGHGAGRGGVQAHRVDPRAADLAAPGGRGAQDSSGDSREVLLWDLAGQPGYRIVHQLHLEGAALALILFDAKSETAPLAGVRHWARAVRHAHPAADGGLPTFLVAARADRGGINVSDQRIQQADGGLRAR